jgi:hypothetical protein
MPSHTAQLLDGSAVADRIYAETAARAAEFRRSSLFIRQVPVR